MGWGVGTFCPKGRSRTIAAVSNLTFCMPSQPVWLYQGNYVYSKEIRKWSWNLNQGFCLKVLPWFYVQISKCTFVNDSNGVRGVSFLHATITGVPVCPCCICCLIDIRYESWTPKKQPKRLRETFRPALTLGVFLIFNFFCFFCFLHQVLLTITGAYRDHKWWWN